jgi:hypothetical protein
VVEVEHEGVGAFDESVRRVLVLLQELELVDDVGLEKGAVFLYIVSGAFEQNRDLFMLRRGFLCYGMKMTGFHAYLEPCKLLLNIVCQFAEPCAVGGIQSAQLALEGSLVQDLADANTAACGLVAVTGTDALTGGADLAAAETLLLETVDDGVEVETDVCAVRDEDALCGALQALGLDIRQFLEETGDVEDGAGANQVDTFWRDETGGKDVEVVGDIVVDNGVAGI